MATQVSRIERIAGRAIPLRGNDIDTDRIIPARYLKTITFDGLEDHVFEDDRHQLAERGTTHPFDDARFRGAQVAVRAGEFRLRIVARARAAGHRALGHSAPSSRESYAEIFFGNSLMMGMPCVTASPADIERLIALAESQPDSEFTLDLDDVPHHGRRSAPSRSACPKACAQRSRPATGMRPDCSSTATRRSNRSRRACPTFPAGTPDRQVAARRPRARLAGAACRATLRNALAACDSSPSRRKTNRT